MIYLWIKSAHLVAVIIWMSAMLAAPLIARLLGADAREEQRRRLTSLFNSVATPSMLVALLLGVWLMVSGDWFDAGWMQVKLVAVIAMAAIHGMLSGAFRRYASDECESLFRRLNRVELVSVLLMVLIVLLVVTKTVPW
ncbi:MAG: CopD family protein [Pseudomonadota bacterium]